MRLLCQAAGARTVASTVNAGPVGHATAHTAAVHEIHTNDAVASTAGLPPLRLFNSVTGRVEDITSWACAPIRRPITMYVCGPTVYDAAHIGHARTYVLLDAFRAFLGRVSPRGVLYVQGVTDVDDKLLAAAARANTSVAALAREQEAAFFRDMHELGVAMPDASPRVTEHIPAIIDFVAQLLQRGAAYEAQDGVYFDVAAFSRTHTYAKLRPHFSGASEAREQSHTHTASHAHKRDPRDFALWKTHVQGDPQWDAPWGRGRPGWHIECSTFVRECVGVCVDVHAGGADLAFPHHTNEMAQSEAAHGTQEWAKLFMHTGHVHINGRKMSKSLKNFVSVRELLHTRTHAHTGTDEDAAAAVRRRATAFRVACFMYHYRSHVTHSEDRMREADAIVSELREAAAVCARVCEPDGRERAAQTRAVAPIPAATLDSAWALSYSIDDALRDDFDTPAALAHLRHLGRVAHTVAARAVREGAAPRGSDTLFRLYMEGLNKLGIHFDMAVPDAETARRAAPAPLPGVITFRDEVRAVAKSLTQLANQQGLAQPQPVPHSAIKSAAQQLFKACDTLRSQLESTGATVRDTGDRPAG